MLISIYLLDKQYSKNQKLGIFAVVIGLLIVGSSNLSAYNSRFAPKPYLGNLLVIIAQIFLAGMFVYEEKILKEYKN